MWYWCVPGATATWRGCNFPSFGKSWVPPQLRGRFPFLVLARAQNSPVWVTVPRGASGCHSAWECHGVHWVPVSPVVLWGALGC